MVEKGWQDTKRPEVKQEEIEALQI